MNNTSEQLDRRALLQNALVALEEMQAKLDASEQARREPIAIIGLSCRFPRGANSPEEFWQLLRDNVDAVTEVPPERWNADEYYDANPDAMGKMYTRHGAFLDAFPDKFDAAFFGISPREAITMDPQHRLLLEVSWEALENAGMSPNSLAGSQTGVFVGMCTNDYSQMQARLGGVEIMDTYSGSGAAHSIAAGRISYTLGLHGPCVTVDTACSSSLVSIHLAVQSLRLGESALALAGGVNLTLGPDGAIATSRGRMLSADGHCKTFDALANGYVRGEGCGVVVLKRLSDALAAGDTILALVRGSAINQDGRSNGLTAPHGPSQEAVIRAALADAKLEPGDVNYIEAHGTGTSLGDPIEVNAIGAVMADSHSFENPLMIGAVKSNIGHLEGAAGVAGLIKIVLAMQNGVIPSNLHFHNPNPLIPWDELPVKIPTQNLSWPAGDKKRVAGVSSFGFSGTNAHLIIEEAPMREKPPAPPVERPLHLLALSAKGEAATRDLARQFVETPNISLADLCYTANTGRSHFSSRVALTANTTEQLREKLAAVADGKMPVNTTVAKGQPRVAFLFTGQGSQYAGMARQLYETQPSFRKTLDKCDELLRPYLNPSLLSLLFSPTGSPSLLDQTAYTQPALFAVEYALAELWRSWGVEPTVVLGHSVGEYVAACVAGVFSLEDGLRLIAERGRLMGALPAGGEMVAVFADEARVTKAIATAPAPEAVSIAAINGLANVVISGAGQAIQTIVEKLKAEGVKSKRLVVSHAFHSPLMEPILDEFEQVAAGVSFATPQIGVMSNVTGQMATADDLTNADYWRRHVRGAVRFADSILALQQQGYDLFIEIGPKPTLMSMGQQCWPGGGQPATWLPSLREGRDDWQSLLDSLGALYMQGLNVDWAGFDADYAPARSKVTLPTYPFQRARYWFTLPESRRDDRARDRKVLHPLLHGRLRSPALKETVFESEFSADWPSFLKDHQIYETVIFPGTGYLEMALAAASQLGPGPLVLESVSILNPFMLPEGETRVAQVVLSPVEDGRASFKILSLEVEDSTDSWKLHATGEIRVGEAQTALKKIDLAEVGGEAVDAGDYYRSLSELGVEYGPTFQGVKKLWRGEAAAWGEIRLAPEAGEASSFHLHPALLDAAFHVVGVALPRVAEGEGDVYLPVGMGRLTVYASGQAGAWARVTAQPGHETVTSDLELFDETGQLVAELRGLTLKRASRQALRSALGSQKSLADWFYETAWRPKALSEPKENAKGSWLVFAERGGLGEALAAQLKEQGVTCDVVLAGESFAALDAGRWQVNPARPEDFAQLRRECGPRDGVVYLWSADTDGDSPEAVAVSVLHLVQAMASGETKPGLWLVTRGAQTVAGKGHSLNQSPVWGLGKTIALEYPDLHCIRLDLDPAGETDEVKSLLAEVVAGDGEPQVARRNGARHAARLARTKTKAAQPFEFAFTSRGVLDNIVLRPLTRRQPGPGEVEIQVRASGLNFRDVLNVLGMYPGDPGIPGTECAGVVAAVGEGVADLKVGDSVVGVATGAFSSYAIARAALLAPKPDTMSFAEAATIPIAFMTALYGLKHLAKMKRGAKVLIHAAAGGVGLAAVQLAKQAGAEIFGTAGSPEKRAFLKSLGVQHIMSSRTLDFADEITKITGGQGVDIVLNALADDFITRSVSVLAEDGCFLEIGKRGIWTEEQMKAVKPGVTYFPYDLSYVLTNDVPLWQSMLRELIAGFASGALTTLPLHAFPAHEITDAFRFMAQARHTGKVVIIHHPTGDVAHENATYLITGGLGGLGLKVAQWMVGQGARHLALVGRSGAAGSSGEAVSEMERTGAQVKVFKADISQKEQVAKVLAEIAHTMPPLQGIVHAAGVLDDGMLAQQDRDRFARVLGPKVNGATALHELTHGLPLDFFVLFSSAASLLGAAGQGNYAAANAFMDALAHARQAQGLPALSLNWGAWSEVGMAAAQSEREQRRWASQGMGLISPDQGMQAFGEALRLSLAQAGILPIHWPRLTRQFNGNVPHLYQELAGESASADSGGRAVSGPDVMKQLEAAAPEERYDLLLVHVQEQVARVFGLDPAKPLDRRQALAEMGMDSLMSVELKNRLQSSLGRSLPTTLAFDHPTIEALAGYLATEVLALGGTPMMPVVAGNGDGQAEVAISVDELSDDEVNSMLNAMLADGGTQI